MLAQYNANPASPVIGRHPVGDANALNTTAQSPEPSIAD
jgi:hypothetical protein